nr:ataxin-3 isoform X2 [Anolis sagrei ordinatus]
MKKKEKEWQKEDFLVKNIGHFYSNPLETWMIVAFSQFNPLHHQKATSRGFPILPEQVLQWTGGCRSERILQVISNALKVWGLELILFNSPEYQRLGINPINERSFICNYKEHWFTVRKLGKQWFNLNSLLTGPELISDTYLALFLAQLQQEGYSIFVVKGDLPDCEADQLLQIVQVQQMQRPKLIGEDSLQSKDQRVQKPDVEQTVDVNHSDGTAMLDEDEENFQKALALSRQEIDMEDEEADLRRAIQLSMQGGPRTGFPESSTHNVPHSSGTNLAESLTSEELRRRRQAYFEKQQQLHQQVQNPEFHGIPVTSTNAQVSDPGGVMSEDDMLQAAMNMSLETVRNNMNVEEKK